MTERNKTMQRTAWIKESRQKDIALFTLTRYLHAYFNWFSSEFKTINKNEKSEKSSDERYTFYFAVKPVIISL